MTPGEKDYKALLYEEKLDRINEKLDELTDCMQAKASALAVDSLSERLKIMEDNHTNCPMHEMYPDVKELKKDRDILMDATEDQRFYKKRPGQFKMVIIGFFVMVVIYLATLIPIVLTARSGLKTLHELKPKTTQSPPTSQNQSTK